MNLNHTKSLWASMSLGLMLALQVMVAAASGCDEYDSTLDCRGRGLTEIPVIPPYVTTALLDDNKISELRKNAFANSPQLTTLRLKKNVIRRLHENSFKGLKNLLSLHLGRNKLCLGNDSYPPGVFREIPNLQVLNIASNTCHRQQFYPEEAFADLRSLETLALSGLTSKLGDGFASMVNLKTLMFMGTTSYMNYLERDTFEALRNLTLTRLSLRNSNITRVSSYTLRPLKHLQYLNVACNPFLRLTGIWKMIAYMASPTLHTLSVDGSFIGASEVVTINLNNFNSPKLQNLKRFSLHEMAIIDINTAELRFLASLETLVLGHTQVYIEDDANQFLQRSQILANSSLKFLALPYFSDPKYSVPTFRIEYCHPDEIDEEDALFFRNIEAYGHREAKNDTKSLIQNSSSCVSRSTRILFEQLFFGCFPPNVQVLSLDHTQMLVIRNILSLGINPVNNVKMLNLTKMGSATGSIDLSLLSKFTQLETLDATYCQIFVIDNDSVQLQNLMILRLDNNNIEKLDSPFGGTPNLAVLSIRNNRLFEISRDVFEGLTRLTHVYLSGNFIESTFFQIQANPLQLLDLSSNRITHLNSLFLDQFGKLSSALQLDVTNNTMLCSCNSLPFRKWLTTTSVNVVNKHKLTCYSKAHERSVLMTDPVPETEKLSCSTLFISVVTVVCIVSVFTIAIILFYNFRWKVKLAYFIFLRRLRLKLTKGKCNFLFLLCCDSIYKKMQQQRQSEFEYDAFLAHDGADYEFIIDGFLDKMESWGLKIYVAEKDGAGGVPIVHNLVDAIDSSRLVICLLTPGFAKSDWCDFELKMSLDRGKESVVFIYKEEIPWKMASNILSKIIYDKDFIEYTEDPDGNRLFWDQLKEILTKGKKYPNEQPNEIPFKNNAPPDGVYQNEIPGRADIFTLT